MLTKKLRDTLTAARQIDEDKEDTAYPTLRKAYTAELKKLELKHKNAEGLELIRYFKSMGIKIKE